MTGKPYEFTGERVIPGEVGADLWNEHLARYAFAARLARNRRVLDLGCGTGYGSAELAHAAREVVGLDVSMDAVSYARASFGGGNRTFLQASCTALPFRTGYFDLVVAFELIEHLTNWPELLTETRRVLAAGGQLIVSTPNKAYYSESRKAIGPNPYHEHEFEYEEFRTELSRFFPHVSLFLQNHSEGIVFQPLEPAAGSEVRLAGDRPEAADSHFYVAVCALGHQTGAPLFLYLPSTGNVLRERELHIDKLAAELETKNEWLEQQRREHAELVDEHRKTLSELEQRNEWAGRLNRELEASMSRVAALQEELSAEQAAARRVVAEYEAKIAELEADVAARTQWAQETEVRLSGELAEKVAELGRAAELLARAEETVVERTNWALRLDEEAARVRGQLSQVRASRWVRLGRLIGLGPEVAHT